LWLHALATFYSHCEACSRFLLLLLLLLRWHSVQCQPSSSQWTSLSQLLFLTSLSNFYFALISVCIQIHHLFFGPHNILSIGLLLNILLMFLLLSIVLMWPNWFIHYQNLQTAASVLFYHVLHFSFTIIPPKHSS